MQSRTPRYVQAGCLALGLLVSPLAAYAATPATLPQFVSELTSVFNPNAVPYANVLRLEQDWGRSRLAFKAPDLYTLGELDAQGYPKSMAANAEAWLQVSTRATRAGFLPDGQPQSYYFNGVYTLTWEGDGDVSLSARSGSTVTPLSERLTGTVKKRVYRVVNADFDVLLKNNAVANYAKNIALWAPDVKGPKDANGNPSTSLDPETQGTTLVWNPAYIDLIKNGPSGVLRFHVAASADANPLENWADRRPENYLFQLPSPLFDTAALGENSVDTNGNPPARNTGMSYELMVDLCNKTGKDLWLCLPHAASDGFYRSLATMIFARLAPDRRVWLEYANEVWHGTGDTDFSVAGGYAVQRAKDLQLGTVNASGVTTSEDKLLAALYASRRVSEIWSIFESTFGSQKSRIIGVAGTWSNSPDYSRTFLGEAKAYGASLGSNPDYGVAVDPDVLGITTYFGIEAQVFNNFDLDMANGTEAGYEKAFRLWKDYVYSGVISVSNAQGDTEGGAGFKPEHVSIAAQYDVALVATEGGPNNDPGSIKSYEKDLKIVDKTTPGAQYNPEMSKHGGKMTAFLLYPNNPKLAPWWVGADVDNPATTKDETDINNSGNYSSENPYQFFINGLERHPGLADVYTLHMSIAESLGVTTNSLFTDVATYSKYGNWGHLEHVGQNPAQVVKWKTVADFAAEYANFNVAGRSTGPGGSPQIVTPATLPTAVIGKYYEAEITATGGDGALTFKAISPLLPPGLQTEVQPGKLLVYGVPVGSVNDRSNSTGYLFVRVSDADGDISFKKFQLNVRPPLPSQLGANITLNSDLSSAYGGRLDYGIRIGLAQAGAGWISNGSNKRTFTTRATSGGNSGAYILVNNGSATQDASILQLIKNNKSATGLGVLSFDAYKSSSDVTFAVYGFSGTDAQVADQLATSTLVTSDAAPDGAPKGVTLLTGSLQGTGEASWANESYLVDFGAGYDYLVVVFSARAGTGVGTGLDNITLRPASSVNMFAEAVQPTAEEEGRLEGVFTLTRTGKSGPLTVNYSLGGTASSADYNALPSTATIADGQYVAFVNVVPVDDTLVESDETVVLTVNNGIGYTPAGAASATVTIRDNDVPDLVINGGFDNGFAARLGFSDALSTAYAGTGWVENVNNSRPLTIANGKLVLGDGTSRPETVYQIIANAKASKGQGLLGFDVLKLRSGINYAVYGYNGTASAVTAALAADNFYTRSGLPTAPAGGTRLVSGALSTFTSTGSKNVPVNFGTGYDYIIIGISTDVSAPVGTTEELLDNVMLFGGK